MGKQVLLIVVLLMAGCQRRHLAIYEQEENPSQKEENRESGEIPTKLTGGAQDFYDDEVRAGFMLPLEFYAQKLKRNQVSATEISFWQVELYTDEGRSEVQPVYFQLKPEFSVQIYQLNFDGSIPSELQKKIDFSEGEIVQIGANFFQKIDSSGLVAEVSYLFLSEHYLFHFTLKSFPLNYRDQANQQLIQDGFEQILASFFVDE